MTIKFLLLVNKHGQTRLARYLDQTMGIDERRAMEGEIVRKCLRRTEKHVSSFYVHIHHNINSLLQCVDRLPSVLDVRRGRKQDIQHILSLPLHHPHTSSSSSSSSSCTVFLYRAPQLQGRLPPIRLPLFPSWH